MYFCDSFAITNSLSKQIICLMKLKKLFFKNHITGWCLKEVNFGPLTLLVGASGVGKTQTLKAISQLSRIAAGYSMNGCEWRVEFEESGLQYVWAGQFGVSNDTPDSIDGEEPRHTIVKESLVVGADETEIFTRDAEELQYHGIPTVKLDPTKSAVELLKEQPDITPVRNGFKKINWLKMETSGYMFFSSKMFDHTEPSRTFEDIKLRKQRRPIDNLFLIMRYAPDVFADIKETFTDIFPLVEDIDYDIRAIRTISEEKVRPVLKIKEKDVDTWIQYPNISAGMYRTLSQIVALKLADDGDVILIDEFENGLGINCIDKLAEMAQDPDVNVQIIMTSHHPYIINSIPFRAWRIVSRSGSDVTVNTADELRIGKSSKHDAFMQLIQTTAYRTGRP